MSAMTGIQIMKQFVPASPFVGHVGISLERLDDGEADLRLTFAEHVATMGTTIHGGAIATLIDTAAMAAAWAGAPVPENLRGSTVGLTVSYLAAANGTDVMARARVLRRGKSLAYVEVDVSDASGEPVAKGLVTYKIG